LSFNNLTTGQEGAIFNFSSLECVYDLRCTEAGGMWTVKSLNGAPMRTLDGSKGIWIS